MKQITQTFLEGECPTLIYDTADFIRDIFQQRLIKVDFLTKNNLTSLI